MATQEEIDAWTAQLAEARQAYHLLMMGQAEVSWQYENRRIQYNLASVGNLRAYIAELERLIAGAPIPRRGAIRYVTPV